MTTSASHPTLAEIISVLEQMYDPSWARDWDAVGLVCGDPQARVRRVLMAVDPSPVVVEEALAWRADLVLTHHPLLFRAVHAVPANTAKGWVVHQLVKGDCALYAAHTNADAAAPGVSDALARVLGLTDLVPLAADPVEPLDRIVTRVPAEVAPAVLDAMCAAGGGDAAAYRQCAWIPVLGAVEPGPPGEGRAELEVVLPRTARGAVLSALRSAHPEDEPVVGISELASWSGPRGIGRIGRLATPTTLREFAMLVAEALPSTTQGVRVAGDPTVEVSRVAVCGGSGDSLLDAARAAGVDVYVTADLRHHPSLDARESAREGAPYLVDVAHWASEWPWLAGAANRLAGAMEAVGTPIEVHVSVRCTDPWTFRVPSPGGVVR